MSYTKHNYASGDILEAADLNEMDNQIAKNELTVFNATINTQPQTHVGDTQSIECSVTYQQVAAAWPNCVLLINNNTYMDPLYYDGAQYIFMGFSNDIRRRCIVTSEGWTVDLAYEYESANLGRVLVIGDSMCAGNSNNTKKWPSWLTMGRELRWTSPSNTIVNAAAYGAAFGSYSITGATSLLAQLNANASFVSSATGTVLVCSCYNDVKAAEAGRVTYDGILDAAKIVFDRIRALNANTRIVYLSYCSGLITNSSGYETGWAGRCKPMDTALRALCVSEGIQVMSLTSGSGYNSSFVQGDNMHPTDSGMDKIGKAMRNKLLDKTSTLLPDPTVILDFNTVSNINPYKYDFGFLQRLYIKYGIEVKIRLQAVTNFWCLGTIAYISDPSADADVAMFYSGATATYNPTSVSNLERYITLVKRSGGTSTTTCVHIATG